MQRRISAVLTCGLAAALMLAVASPADAQARSTRRIPVKKDTYGRTTTESSGAVQNDTAAARMRQDSINAANAERMRQDSIAAAERARQDSLAAIERARQDSIARVEQARRDSVARADSIARAEEAARQRRMLLGRWGGATFRLGAGLSLPQKAFKDYYKNGFNVTGGIGYSPVNWPVGVQFDVGYDRWGGKDLTAIGGSGVQENASIWSGIGNLTLHVPNLLGVSPYLTGGGGVYRFADLGGTDTQAHWKGGWNAGAGVKFGVGLTNLFVESRYHSVKMGNVDDTKFIPVILGISFR